MPAKRKFHDAEWREFLKRIGEGNSANQVCKQADMPSWRLVSEKLNSDSDFATRYSVAMENRGQVYADKIAEIIDAVIDGRIDPNAGRVAIDGLKWTSAKLAPKKYGDIHRHEVKHTGTDYVAALKAIAEEKHNADGDEVRARTDEQAATKGKASLH